MKKYFKKISVAAIACAVAVSSLPGMTVLAEESQNNSAISNSGWSEDIDSMLDGQDYIEGQVIAVFDNSVSEGNALSTLSDDEESEDLGTLSDDAVEETIDADLKKSDEAAVIRIISSDEKSTEELLNELASNPAVIYAEPDYLTPVEGDEETENSESTLTASEDEVTAVTTEGSDAETTVAPLADSQVKRLSANGTPVDLITEQGYEAVGDLTRDQWGYGNGGTSLYSIHAPNWNATGETNVEDDSVVVGIIDTGIDYTHPDLKDVIVDLSQYSDVAGQYGYNSTGKGDAKDPMDEQGHGTHCAGIMASEWDGTGTSGVASGVKIAAVKAAVPLGFYNSAIIRGFMCLKEATENGMNLKSINCSFGGNSVKNAELMIINELGELGVITCFASGNSSNDNDEMANSCSGNQVSPYVVAVNAENGAGELADFSCYGQSTTDLLSPGCAILSTTCTANSQYMASVDKNRLSYDGFTGSDSESGVKISYLGTYDITETDSIMFESEEEFIDLINNSEPAGEAVKDENSFDGDGYSYKVDVPALTDTNQRACYLVAMPIKEEDVNKLSGFSMALKSSFKQTNVWSRAFKVSTASESEFVGGANISDDDGWIQASDTWSNEPLSLKIFEEDKMAYPYYNGCLYFIAEVQDDEGTGVPGTMYIDSVGAGYSNLRYIFLDGTSMATPAITGSVAVVYSELEKDGTLDDMGDAEKAAYVAATVKAKTVQRDSLKSKCTTEGAFDFNVTEDDYTPVINSSTVTDDRTVTVNGAFLGDKAGSIEIDGQTCKITTWTNDEIIAKLPADVENGRYSFNLTKANGKTATKKIIIDIDQDSEEQAFEGKIELPDEIAGCKLKITALNGNLYAFPETMTNEYANTVVWNSMLCYNIEADYWEQCAQIPVSEQALTGPDNEYNISVCTYKDYVVAQVDYIASETEESTTYADEFYIYNPKKNLWTQLDLSDLEVPDRPMIVGCDAGLFLVGGTVGTQTSDDIYKITFDLKQVKKGASTVKATKLTNAGTYPAPSVGYATVSSYGNEIFVCSANCAWLKWSEADQKFDVQIKYVNELIGGQGHSVSFFAEFTGCLTPSGAVITAMNGNDYTDRGYDTFYLSEDGTRTAFDKVSSFADLYNTCACYSDGIMYVWGDSVYSEEETMGVLSYTAVNMPKIYSAELSGNTATVNWRPLDYEGYVRVFYKAGNGAWKIAEDSTGTSCTVSGLKNGTKYTFTVRAVDEKGIDYISDYDKTGTSVIYLTRPVISKAVSTKSGCATLNWSKNSKATGYQILYKYGSTRKKITITSNETVAKVIKSLKKGKTYKFYVRSYKKVDGKKYYSRWSKVKTVKIKK